MDDAFDKLVKHLEGPPAVPQAAFAELVGAQQSEVSLWTRRLRRPPLKYIPALRKLLGTTVEDWISAPLAKMSKPRKRRAA
jgi:transcriptional regulator with XRE-family HTH domain